MESGLRKQAIEHLVRAVELNPDDSSYRYVLGMAYLAVGDVKQAQFQLAEGNRLSPSWPDLHQKLALAYLLGPEPNLTAAREHALKAQTPSGKDFRTLTLLAYIDFEQGDVQDAEKLYDESLQLDPNWPREAILRARQLLKRTPNPWDSRVGLLYTRQACQATKDRQGDFLETLAAIEFAAGHKPEAIQTLRKALALSTQKGDQAHSRALEEQLKSYAQ